MTATTPYAPPAAAAKPKPPWTFVLTGDVRSGTNVVRTSIVNRGGVACHVGLFDPDEDRRKEAHESQVSDGPDPIRGKGWLVDGETNAWHYLDQTVLDQPGRGEVAVGCLVPYAAVRKYELYDLFERRGRDGGFGVINVVRNPVACYLSLKQAESSGLWAISATDTHDRGRNVPSEVRVKADDLTRFCRDSIATGRKIRETCPDRLEIEYRDLVVNYQKVMRQVFDFLELPYAPVLAKPGTKRLRNNPLHERFSNLDEVRAQVPSDVRELLDRDELF